MIKKLFLFFILSFFAFAGNFVLADETYNFNAFICDNAQLLPEKTENLINSFLWDLQKKTGTDIAVVTVNSLDGRTVEETALNIGRKIKLGQKGKDNGAVILVAPNERKMRIEIGYGLEGIIPDGKAGRIRDEEMLPYFSKGNYEDGIFKGAYTLANIIAKENNTTLSYDGPVPASPSHQDDSFWLLIFVVIFLCIRFNVFPLFIPVGGYRSYGGGFSSGGFGGFGGEGGFGGGGASGSW